MDVNGPPKAVIAVTAGVIPFPNSGIFPICPHGTGECVQCASFFYDPPTTANETFSAEHTGRVEMYMDGDQVLGDEAHRGGWSCLKEGLVSFANMSAQTKMLGSANGYVSDPLRGFEQS